MAQDYGIFITQPGTDATTQPKLNKTTLNTAYAQLKIDTTNVTGFQTLTLSIVNDPPEPGVGHVYTVVYKYKHGYTYKPAIETLFNITTPPPATSYSTPYFLDWTALAQRSVNDYAAMYAVADDTWIYYIVDKWNGGGGLANLLTGCNINITTHAFLDGVGV
jgi:hypothetical protein